MILFWTKAEELRGSETREKPGAREPESLRISRKPKLKVPNQEIKL